MRANKNLWKSYFNPRSHKGSDKDRAVWPGCRLISIHAPTRGATVDVSMFSLMDTFQSTLPQGERPGLTQRRLPQPQISIHAPTRGATSIRFKKFVFIFNFNPRSHKGSDDVGKLQGRRDVDFNPRSHKGSDRCGKAPRSARCGFQSTLPQGERPISLCSSVRPVNISIHAPTRGATSQLVTVHEFCPISIHAPTRGATV